MSSVAVQTYIETRIESRYTSFIGSRCGYPGLYYFTYLSKEAGAVCKNCDEPINFIDRVIGRSYSFSFRILLSKLKYL